MPDDPNKPPVYAIPLARALVELCGDFSLDCHARITELELACTGFRSWVGTLERINVRRAEKTLARLRSDELLSWGWADSLGGPLRALTGRIWQRVSVLDRDLGEIGEVLLTGERLLVFYGVVVADRRWSSRDKKPVGRPSFDDDDEPLVADMIEMVLAEPGLSPSAAAWRLVNADKVKGKPGSDPANWVDRLVRRYRENYAG